MQMTVGEIQRNYSQAKNKSQQIGILADLNCCSREDIEKIVGVEDKREKVKTQPKVQKRTNKEPEVNAILDSLFARLDTLEQEIKDKEEEYRKINIAIEVLGGMKTSNL